MLGEKSLCKHGCVNVLTRDKGTSGITQSNCGHGVLANLEIYKGKIKLVAAFSKFSPRFLWWLSQI
nr:hypothetical protein [Campylobacter concisus]